MKKFHLVILVITLSLFSCKDEVIIQPQKNYGYDSWPGKSGVIKTGIEFPGHFISEYDLSLNMGARGDSFSYSLPLDKNDNVKIGIIDVKVFSSVEEAQLGLVNYLDAMETPYKPPRLTDEDFSVGDVAFGKVYDGILRIEFVRNNVRVIVVAPEEIAKIIIKEIDEKIQLAPEWHTEEAIPSYILIE